MCETQHIKFGVIPTHAFEVWDLKKKFVKFAETSPFFGTPCIMCI